jgi:hypothetical protein
MDPKPYEGDLEFDVEESTDLILAHAPDDVMPGEGESRYRRGCRHLSATRRSNSSGDTRHARSVQPRPSAPNS